MKDKIHDLCDMQLSSIVVNAEASVRKVTGGSSEALKISTDILDKINDQGIDKNELKELCENLHKQFNVMLTNLQFFDEFTQRIDHVKKLLRFLDMNISEKDESQILENISSIFSISSEYEVMKEIFPDFVEVQKTEAIELF